MYRQKYRQKNKFIHASQKNEAELALMRTELTPNVDFQNAN